MELQFSSGVLSYPDRVNMGGEEYRDGEVPIPGSLPDVNAEDKQLYVEHFKLLTLGKHRH